MTDRIHFDDLTKINVPFGLLDDETQERLRVHGGSWEMFDEGDWSETKRPGFYSYAAYRAKPQPLTKPAVQWDMMADWVKAVVKNQYGELIATDQIVRFDTEYDEWEFTYGQYVELVALKIDPGTCDWRDSLVKRPEGV